ncbi:MAG: hypothetical protein M1820_004612 [Bogoriella megaspora]|nr:MAG: hypothetical protein M1820_004612 [Bogoriella megaspora]
MIDENLTDETPLEDIHHDGYGSCNENRDEKPTSKDNSKDSKRKIRSRKLIKYISVFISILSLVLTAAGLVTLLPTFRAYYSSEEANQYAKLQTELAVWSADLAFKQDCEARMSKIGVQKRKFTSGQWNCSAAVKASVPPPPQPTFNMSTTSMNMTVNSTNSSNARS